MWLAQNTSPWKTNFTIGLVHAGSEAILGRQSGARSVHAILLVRHGRRLPHPSFHRPSEWWPHSYVGSRAIVRSALAFTWLLMCTIVRTSL